MTEKKTSWKKTSWKKKFNALLQEIDDGYYECDLNGNTLLFNRALCNIFGIPPEEIQGQNIRKIRPFLKIETYTYVRKVYDQVHQTGRPGRGIIHEITNRQGEKRIIENSVSLKLDAEGAPVGFRSIVRDITERKRTEDELARHRSRLQAIFGSVSDAILTVDTQMRVIEANKATQKICKAPLELVSGNVLTDCMDDCRQACRDVLNEVLETKVIIQERRVTCHHRLHPQQVVSVTASPLMDHTNHFMGAVMLIRDISRLSNLERELIERYQFHNLIGKSNRMQEIYGMLEDLADIETTVLITGESGTGKELVAKALHYQGNRKDKPLIKVNCSALAENLLESELFGHIKGAFTGALNNKNGRFQVADGGTIFLDEIGDISPRIQLKLLRVLQEKEFERVGESLPVRVDVRVIAATNKNLRKRVKSGEFREDLFYRLNVMEISLPPLQERQEDIPLLVRHFITLFNQKFSKNIRNISEEVLELFMNYSWPGNIRELEHAIERAFVLCHEATIEIRHMPSEILGNTGVKKAILPGRHSVQREEILMMLRKTDGNKAKAARLLGIDRRTLYRKISKYQLKNKQMK